MASFRGDTVQASAFIGSQFLTQGKTLFVKPRTGGGYDGLSPRTGVKTLLAALAKAAANRNDIINLMAEGASADPSDTSDLLVATLDWNLSLTHLRGAGNGSPFGSRARIAFASDYVGTGNLFTVSGRSCRFQDLEFIVDVASANPLGCLNVTGSRNVFMNCQISGMGNDLLDTTGNYSLRVSGGENYFGHCIIGLDTIPRGTGDNCELLLAGGARNMFEDCIFVTFAEANTHQFVKRAVSSTDRSTIFRNCAFLNFDWTAGGGVTMLEVFDVAAGGSPGGFIDLDAACYFAGAAAWEASSGASGIVRYPGFNTAGAISATSAGRALAVTGA
jgi:hypothetical protein